MIIVQHLISESHSYFIVDPLQSFASEFYGETFPYAPVEVDPVIVNELWEKHNSNNTKVIEIEVPVASEVHDGQEEHDEEDSSAESDLDKSIHS